MNTDAIRSALMRDEGLRLKPYQDTVGKFTIGVGRNLDDRGITKGEAMVLLDNDIAECVNDLSASFAWFAALDEVRQHVVVNMRFQLGAAGFRKFKQTIAHIAAGAYAQAAESMSNSKWAEQVPNRANRLIEEMRSGAALQS